jgi:hypothetical protein
VLTGDTGNFRVPEKLASPFTIRISKDGYVSTTRNWLPAGRPPPPVEADGIDFWIELSRPGPVVSLTGTYTLTLTADDRACAALPAEARTRTYTATVLTTPKPTDFGVVLSGSELVSPDDSFGAQTAGEFVRFDVYRYFDEPEPAIVEQLQGGGYLAILGSAPASAEPSGIVNITVPFDASFEYCPGQMTSNPYR